MLSVRQLLAQRYFAVFLCVATLLLKLIVPAGYMIGSEHGRLTIELCSGVAERPAPKAMPGMYGDMPGHGDPQKHGKSQHDGTADVPCPFTILSAVSLDSVDPIQLASLIAFVVAIGLWRSVLPAIVRRGYLRPPLRGPPLSALIN